MYYEENVARELVIKVGQKLKELGLVPRTWGNISARISDTQFVVTPSGRPYDTITPDQTVVVDINTLKYDSKIRPSDEMGIHADAYKLRDDVNFVIHTHQDKACVMSATGLLIDDVPNEYKNIVGDCIPCGGYGLPSTKKLCRGVKSAVEKYPNSKAAIMKHHGAVCMGKDEKEALNIALAVEEVCRITIENNYKKVSKSQEYNKIDMINYYLSLENADIKLPNEVEDLGASKRNGDKFTLTFKDGKELEVNIDECLNNENFEPKVAKIHSKIYKATNVSFIKHLTNDYTKALSVVGKKMIPYLDDFSQIAGTSIRCASWDSNNVDESINDIAKQVKGKNAVLIKNCGALCIASEESDIEAIGLIMEKDSETEVGVKLFGVGEPLPYSDRYIMRNMYLHWYTQQIYKQP